MVSLFEQGAATAMLRCAGIGNLFLLVCGFGHAHYLFDHAHPSPEIMHVPLFFKWAL
jgi:hypothetical protein